MKRWAVVGMLAVCFVGIGLSVYERSLGGGVFWGMCAGVVLVSLMKEVEGR